MQTEDFFNLQIRICPLLVVTNIYIVKSTGNIHTAQIFPQLTSSLPVLKKDPITDRRKYECFQYEIIISLCKNSVFHESS